MATDDGLVPGGIYQDAHGDIYMRDPFGHNLWLHPGEERAFRDSEVARPLTRYVPAPAASAPAKGKADTRIFRITRSGTPVIHYGPRKVLGPAIGYQKSNGGHGSWQKGTITKIEATNADATEGWTDVTSEFLG